MRALSPPEDQRDCNPGRCHLGPRCLRCLGHPGSRHLQYRWNVGQNYRRPAAGHRRLLPVGFPVAFLMFKLIDKTVGLRVSPEEELEGLDVTEHGGNAYPDFEVYSYGSMGSGGGSAVAPAAGLPRQVDLEPVKQT